MAHSPTPADELREKLRRVSFVKFTAKSTTDACLNGSGAGQITLECSDDHILVLAESGDWRPLEGRTTRFRNVFRWTHLAPDCVRLEHLRFGADHAVHLFDLAPDANGTWTSISPHVCAEDCYTAILRIDPLGVDIQWDIAGPKKQHSVSYEYRWHDA